MVLVAILGCNRFVYWLYLLLPLSIKFTLADAAKCAFFLKVAGRLFIENSSDKNPTQPGNCPMVGLPGSFNAPCCCFDL